VSGVEDAPSTIRADSVRSPARRRAHRRSGREEGKAGAPERGAMLARWLPLVGALAAPIARGWLASHAARVAPPLVAAALALGVVAYARAALALLGRSEASCAEGR
jgi:hypothetical protein